MKAVTAPVGAKFVDCWAGPTTAAQAKALATEDGAAVILRYEDMGAEELDWLLEEGLLVGLVITSPAPGYQPSAALAQSKYQAAVAHFVSLDVPETVSVIADLETMGGESTDRIAYANAAAAVIASARLDPAGYIGSGVGLTSAELYVLAVNRYLKGLSRVTDTTSALAEPACGWVGYQVYPGNQRSKSGVLVDYGILGTDYEGRALVVIGP
jgi:hypothetical protein